MVRKLNTKLLKGLALIIAIWFIGTVAIALLGLNKTTGSMGLIATKPVHEYNSIEKLANKSDLEFKIPDFILLYEDIDKCYEYADGSLNIVGDRFQLHITKSMIIDEKIITNINIADTSDRLSFNKTYSVENNELGIKYLKYQIGDNYTAISWFTDDLSYGLKLFNFDGVNGMNSLIKAVGVDPDTLKEKDEQDIDKSEVTFKEYKFDDLGIKINLPELQDINLITIAESIKMGDANDKVTVILNDKIILILEQTATSNNSESELLNYIYYDGYTIEYFKNNPFDKDSKEYNYYNTLISNINTVVESFGILGN